MNGKPVNAVAALLIANAGLLVWASCFVILYAALSLGCAAALDRTAWIGINALSALLVLVCLVHLAPLCYLLYRVHRHPLKANGATRVGPFHRRLTTIITIAGIVGIVWIGLPALVVPPCA